MHSVELSIIAPAHNEQDNLSQLIREIIESIEPTDYSYEIIIVDDCSTDDSPAVLDQLACEFDTLRVIRLTDSPSGRPLGQSAAFSAGFRAARGELIGLLDADLQNDPADFPAMLELLKISAADMVQGDRLQTRHDSLPRRISSRVGWVFRRVLLGDTIRDTGCSLRVLRRDVAFDLPLVFRGMHRFIPIIARQLGYTVIETPVNHRPRVAGRSSYGMWNRALPGLVDCLAVRWMHNRRRPVRTIECTRSPEILPARGDS